MKRYATANWKGTGKEGKGHISTQSPALDKAEYSAGSRFEEEKGTNPEELVAAAHAGCFTMKLSFNLSLEKFVPENIDTKCIVRYDKDKATIVESHLIVKATVPGISKEKFEELVEHARLNCPISKVLNAEITCDSTLVQ